MDNLITFYSFLDLTSVGKGNTLVSVSRASNVIVIIGLGTTCFLWWQAATCCSMVLDEGLEEMRESCKEVRSIWIGSWGVLRLRRKWLETIPALTFFLQSIPSWLWQKADDKKREESNKVQPLYKRRSFPEGRRMKKKQRTWGWVKEQSLFGGAGSRIKSLNVLISSNSC